MVAVMVVRGYDGGVGMRGCADEHKYQEKKYA